jgi:hypothetical protein
VLIPYKLSVTGVVIFSVALAGVSHSRNPKDAGAAQSAAHPTSAGVLLASNLQVLPRDTPYADLVLLMTRYSQELGVQCVFCHTQNPQTEQVDFASDESPAKLTARIMIGMVRDINGKYLAQVSDRRYAVPITCGNCHQGRTFPPVFEPKLAP